MYIYISANVYNVYIDVCFCIYMYIYTYINIYIHIYRFHYTYILSIFMKVYLCIYIHSNDTHQKNNILSLVTVLEKKKNVFSKCKIDI